MSKHVLLLIAVLAPAVFAQVENDPSVSKASTTQSAESQSLAAEELKRFETDINWTWLPELEIQAPLPVSKRFLGWYVDGEWNVDNREIVFLNYRGKSALITNNLVIRGSFLQFHLEFMVKQDMGQAGSITSVIDKPEVIVIQLSQRIYDIKSFDQFGTVADLSGYSVFFYRKNGKSIARLKALHEQGNYNLQLIHEEPEETDSRLFCEHNYLNASTDMKVFFDFTASTFHVFLNGKNCISYRIDERFFMNPKATLTMVGYSSKVSPIKLSLQKLRIGKVPFVSRDSKPFHADSESILSHVEAYDSLHMSSSSLTNVMLIQGKSRKEIEKMMQLVSLLANRSQKIDTVIGNITRNESNEFYENPIYREKLEGIVKKLEGFLTKNTEMENGFHSLGAKFEEFKKVQTVSSGLEEVEGFVKTIGSMLEVRKFNKLLSQIDKFSDFLEKNKLSKLSNRAELLAQTGSKWEKLIKFAAGFIISIIVVLVILIVKTINHGVKTHVF